MMPPVWALASPIPGERLTSSMKGWRTAMSTGSTTSGGAGAPKPRPSRKAQARLLLSGAAIVLMIVFAVLNTDKVKVDWIVTTTQTPLIVVIIVSFVLGAIGGALLWRRRAG